MRVGRLFWIRAGPSCVFGKGKSGGVGDASSQLTHQTRQYGRFNEARFDGIAGELVMMSERNAQAMDLTASAPMENIQDDYDVWNGAPQLAQWIAGGRHKGGANYLYLDGHVKFGRFEQVLPDQFPDHFILLQPRTY